MSVALGMDYTDKPDAVKGIGSEPLLAACMPPIVRGSPEFMEDKMDGMLAKTKRKAPFDQKCSKVLEKAQRDIEMWSDMWTVDTQNAAKTRKPELESFNGMNLTPLLYRQIRDYPARPGIWCQELLDERFVPSVAALYEQAIGPSARFSPATCNVYTKMENVIRGVLTRFNRKQAKPPSRGLTFNVDGAIHIAFVLVYWCVKWSAIKVASCPPREI